MLGLKALFSNSEPQPTALSLASLTLRLILGGSMLLAHGLPKLQNFSSIAEQFPDPIGLGSTFALGLTVFAEFFCSGLLILGLATRLASIPLAITMAVAAFLIHAADPFQKKELALLYLSGYLALVFLGSGKISLDRFFLGTK